MSKKKNRRQVRKSAESVAAREAAFEADVAQCTKATSVVNNAEALALEMLTDAGWQIESLNGGRGQGYEFLVSAKGACEQIVEARTAMKLVKAVRELGTPDLYPAMVEYEANLPPVLVNGYDGDPFQTAVQFDIAFLYELCSEHMSTKVIELPSPCRLCGDRVETTDGLCRQCVEAGRQVRIIEAARIVYASGRGDFVALSEGENPFAGEGIPIEGNFIQVRDCCESLGMVWKGSGGYNGTSGQFEYPEVVAEEDRANLFPHPATAGLFKVSPRGVGTDPISGALIAPHGKVFELVNQVMGLSHRQKTIESAAWATNGWVAQVVTL